MLRALELAFFALTAAGRVEVEQHLDGFDAHMKRVAKRGWVSAELDHASKEAQFLKLVVAVKHQHRDVLTDELMAVSDPASTRYGRHLSQQEVDALVAPTQDAVAAVTTWLAKHNIRASSVTGSGDFLTAVVSIAQAEALLNTSYASFTHLDSTTTVHRANVPYSLPEEVASHVDFVAPTITFPPLHNRPKRGDPNAKVVTPPFLRDLYNLKSTDVGDGAATNNSMGVASFIKQYYDPKDLTLFWKKYKPPADTAFTDVGAQLHKAEVEASIDSEYIAATGAGINTEMWYTSGVQPGNIENEPFVEWLLNVANSTSPPNVFSISYGDDEDGVTESYAVRCGDEFQKAGARGISLLAASGDSGAGCEAGKFVATFPACNPWVTGVGGLQGGTPGGSTTGESVAALSGGGFSDYFTRPAFQDTAVAAYKNKGGLPAQKMWNAGGAGFPDISAQAIQYDTCSDAFFYPYDGTSCACPTVAGIFSMLNQVRIKAGKAPMGYLNPFIYTQAGAGFNDVTDGKNNYCDNPSAFPATKGWDAVSGFGSPDFAQLKPIVLALP